MFLGLSVEDVVNIDGIVAWRKRQAREDPSDSRNMIAAEMLQSLSREAFTPENHDLHQKIVSLFWEKNSYSEQVREYLRGVGFRYYPSNGRELLERLMS